MSYDLYIFAIFSNSAIKARYKIEEKNIMVHPFSSHHPVGIDLQARRDHGAIVHPRRSDQQIGLQFQGRVEGQNYFSIHRSKAASFKSIQNVQRIAVVVPSRIPCLPASKQTNLLLLPSELSVTYVDQEGQKNLVW